MIRHSPTELDQVYKVSLFLQQLFAKYCSGWPTFHLCIPALLKVLFFFPFCISTSIRIKLVHFSHSCHWVQQVSFELRHTYHPIYNGISFVDLFSNFNFMWIGDQYFLHKWKFVILLITMIWKCVLKLQPIFTIVILSFFRSLALL